MCQFWRQKWPILATAPSWLQRCMSWRQHQHELATNSVVIGDSNVRSCFTWATWLASHVLRNMTLKNDHRHKSHEWPIFSNHGGSYKTAPQQSRKMPAPRTSYPAAFSSSHCQCSSLLWFDARTPLPPLWCRHISEIPRINDVKPKWPSMNQNYPNHPGKELG